MANGCAVRRAPTGANDCIPLIEQRLMLGLADDRWAWALSRWLGGIARTVGDPQRTSAVGAEAELVLARAVVDEDEGVVAGGGPVAVLIA